MVKHLQQGLLKFVSRYSEPQYVSVPLCATEIRELS